MPLASPLAALSDMLLATPAQIIQGAINDAQRTRTIFSSISKGTMYSNEPSQSGPVIELLLYLDAVNTGQLYDPNQEITHSNPQLTTKASIGYRYRYDHISILAHETDMYGLSVSDKNQLSVNLRNAKAIKLMNMATQFVNSMEDHLTANPHGAANYATMENNTSGVMQPLSLFALVNEWDNGLPDGWTTVQKLDPRTIASGAYSPTRRTYAAGDPFDNGNTGTGVMDGVERLILDLSFESFGVLEENSSPGGFGKAVNGNTGGKMAKQQVATSPSGLVLLKRILRANNENMVPRNDTVFGDVNINGTAVYAYPSLANAAIYRTGVAGTYATEEGAGVTASGPRFYFLDHTVLRLMKHSSWWLKPHAPNTPERQPWATVHAWNSWFNFCTRSRRRLAVLYPA